MLDKFNQALQYLRKADYINGKKLLLEILAAHPDNDDALYNLGMVYSETGEIDSSIETLKKCLDVNPFYTNAMAALGFSYYKQGNLAEAAAVLEKALILGPDNVYALRNLGGVLAEQGKELQALEMMKRAHALLPEEATILLGIARLQENLGDLDSAAESFNQLDGFTLQSKQAKMVSAGKQRLRFRKARINDAAIDYLVESLQYFSGQSFEAIKQIVYDIASLGMSGLKLGINEKLYEVPSLSGHFSGIQLVCYLYAGLQILNEKTDEVADLSAEYHAALQIYRRTMA